MYLYGNNTSYFSTYQKTLKYFISFHNQKLTRFQTNFALHFTPKNAISLFTLVGSEEYFIECYLISAKAEWNCEY